MGRGKRISEGGGVADTVKARMLPGAEHWVFHYLVVDFPHFKKRLWIFYKGDKVN